MPLIQMMSAEFYFESKQEGEMFLDFNMSDLKLVVSFTLAIDLPVF